MSDEPGKSADDTPLNGEAIERSRRELSDEWNVVDEHHIVRRYEMRDFAAALAFANSVGDIAEAQGHHPDLLVGWGKLEITIWTHAIDGLSEKDFALAAGIDRLS